MNPPFRRPFAIDLQDLIKGILKGERTFLSKGITLVESKKKIDQQISVELIDSLINEKPKKSLRIGVTGTPGVGKSTFIDVFGTMLTNKGKKVAVLSIDPSSSRTKGSILGDKTRMINLSKDPLSFIRPSASGNSLGGVASKTRESILLCEAAGFEIIIVETVGVGQSETVVKGMVDYFLLLLLAGGGDELQGIKRGIMEMADHILINKAEKVHIEAAKQAQQTYRNALHLFPPNEAAWEVPVDLCSALEETGISEVWKKIEQYEMHTHKIGWFQENRKQQLLKWFHELIQMKLENNFYDQMGISEEIKEKEKMISSQEISVRKAVNQLFFLGTN